MTYNGLTNYETYNLKRCLGKDTKLFHYWRYQAVRALLLTDVDYYKGRAVIGPNSRLVVAFADQLYEELFYVAHRMGLGKAYDEDEEYLDKVDYRQLAKAMLEDFSEEDLKGLDYFTNAQGYKL